MRLKSWRLKDQAHPVEMAGVRLRWKAVEVDYGSVHRHMKRDVDRQGIQDFAESLKCQIELPPGDVVLGFEIPEQRPTPDPEIVRDVLERGLVEALRCEQAKRGCFNRGVRGRHRPTGQAASTRGWCIGLGHVRVPIVAELLGRIESVTSSIFLAPSAITLR